MRLEVENGCKTGGSIVSILKLSALSYNDIREMPHTYPNSNCYGAAGGREPSENKALLDNLIAAKMDSEL
ncbi:hypothetical protein MTR67_020092 [Solanum verrucosum]|uniref:Uncharacterized protein n=1 Tax=Solanum verrucosum TaxID=315347 RepID=A0AAF0TNB0_SOLVR|nr:hypothetical protein MTR67_020092 [Solanum verrucosum]